MDNGQKTLTTEQMLEIRRKALEAMCGKGSEALSKHDYEPEAHGGVNRYLARKKANAKAEAKASKAKAKFQKRNW